MNRAVGDTGQRTYSELLTAARGGDRLAFAEYLSRVLPALRDRLEPHLLMRGRADWTEDIIQEVMGKVLAIISPSSDAEPASLDLKPSWLFEAAKNTAIDWLRKERRASTLRKLKADRHADPGERHQERQLARDQAEPLLALLPGQLRAFFRLLYVDGLSLKDAATACGLTRDAAYQKRRRGLKHLRQALKDNPQLAHRITG